MDSTIISQLLIKLSSLLMLGFLGTSPADEAVQEIGDQIQQRHIGGILLLKRNCKEGPKTLQELTNFLQKKSPHSAVPF